MEIVDARAMQLVHAELPVIVRSPGAAALLEMLNVEPGHVGLWFRDGAYQATLAPGTYAFWKDVGKLKLYDVDLREQALDISGQEIMTADKVTLRLNALVDVPDRRSAAFGDRGRRARRRRCTGPRSSRCARPSARRISTRCW